MTFQVLLSLPSSCTQASLPVVCRHVALSILTVLILQSPFRPVVISCGCSWEKPGPRPGSSDRIRLGWDQGVRNFKTASQLILTGLLCSESPAGAFPLHLDWAVASRLVSLPPSSIPTAALAEHTEPHRATPRVLSTDVSRNLPPLISLTWSRLETRAIHPYIHYLSISCHVATPSGYPGLKLSLWMEDPLLSRQSPLLPHA